MLGYTPCHSDDCHKQIAIIDIYIYIYLFMWCFCFALIMCFPSNLTT